MKIERLFKFMLERHNIYRRRFEEKLSKPWTDDKILRQYRFCNVYRELDTVTQWITEHWRTPHAADPMLWFAMVVARYINWPATLGTLGYPVPWNRTRFISTLRRLQREDKKVFTGAYIVSTNGIKKDKVLYLAYHVLDPLWRDRHAIGADIYGHPDDAGRPTLASVHKALSCYNGVGSFMAAQIIADLKYVRPLLNAEDWHTWAASGPGSRRGLNRVCERSVSAPWGDSEWLETLQKLHKGILPLVKAAKMPELHAQDLQNCLCEFDKYERVRLGEGRPRSTYAGV
jgi:hypothetical protein